MKRYRLGITLFLSLLLHMALFLFLLQKNSLGFKKGIGEHRIKASFREISDFDSQLSMPLKKTPPTQTKQKKAQKKQEKSKEVEHKKETPKPQNNQKVIPEKKEQETPKENQKIEESKDEEIKEQDIQNLTQEETQDSKEPSVPLDYTQSLAYQFADTTTKKNISEFYGPEFGYLGKEEQEYIINNLAYIGRITQKYLRYPANAAMLQQGGGNVVEFYLHPNGDISDLKIIKKSGFILLDRNSIKTIEIAYKDYPHPKTKTLIRFYINYFIRYR